MVKKMLNLVPLWPPKIVIVVYPPPDCAVLPNHEVVEFQPRLVTTTSLGSVDYCYQTISPVPPVHLSKH